MQDKMIKFFGFLVFLSLIRLCDPVQAGTVTYVYTDPQGTPLAEADVQGNIMARFEYTPYGNSVPGLESTDGPGYTGHVNDMDTGLVYMQARYYDPETARFLSIDPLTPKAGEVFNFNRFDYANNNPIRYTDPDGRCPWCVGAIVGTVGGIVIGGATSYVASGGNLRQTLAGAIGGGVGGLISGITLGSASSFGQLAAIGITSGLASEATTETANNIFDHGSNFAGYEYSAGKLAVAGMAGFLGAANSQLAEEIGIGVLGIAQKAVLSQGVALPMQLVTDQVTDHPENFGLGVPVINLPTVSNSSNETMEKVRKDDGVKNGQDYLRIE